MRITWYGHAAFLLEGRSPPVRIVLDPYNYPGCGGYLPIADAADLVCVSHENVKYHSDIAAVGGQPEVLRALEFTGGARTAGGVRFEAFEVYETVRREGPVAMVKLRLDDVTVAHLGDLGHPLSGEALDFLRGVDVLLALAGGAPTIALPDLVELIRMAAPRIVIPMHFLTPKVNLKLLPLESFLAAAAAFPCDRPGGSSLEVTRATLPGATRVVVLEHAR